MASNWGNTTHTCTHTHTRGDHANMGWNNQNRLPTITAHKSIYYSYYGYFWEGLTWKSLQSHEDLPEQLQRYQTNRWGVSPYQLKERLREKHRHPLEQQQQGERWGPGKKVTMVNMQGESTLAAAIPSTLNETWDSEHARREHPGSSNTIDTEWDLRQWTCKERAPIRHWDSGLVQGHSCSIWCQSLQKQSGHF